MSLAEEMLNNMSEEVPVHSHPVPDTDTYFVIDPITRKIENTNRKKNVIMQYDHNSERFTFELPRYIDGHDMLECTGITVNVDNIEIVESGEDEAVEPRVNSDAPDMIDLRVHPNDPEKVISSWLISRNSTQLAGILSFHIEYKCVDSNSNVVYEWSTDTYNEIIVKARKKNGEAALAEHTDLLEQWRTRIFGAGDSVMSNIAAEGEAQVAAVKAESEIQQEAVEFKGAQTLDSIPEDYTEVDAMADEAVRSKADAIVCEAAGESIVLKDSSNDHIRGLRLFGKSTQITTTGKNLLPFTYKDLSKTENGVTLTVNGDGSISFSGTAKGYAGIPLYDGYASVFPNVITIFALGVFNNAVLHIVLVDKNGSTILETNLTSAMPYRTIDFSQYTDVERITVNAKRYDTGAVSGTIYPMIVSGEINSATYEPYTGGKPSPSPDYPQEIVSIENQIIGVYGKNLIDPDQLDCVLNKSLTVSDDKYTITVVGGSDNTYAYSYYNMPDDLVRLLGGRRLRLSIDSASKSVVNAYSPVQINITCSDNTSLYPVCHSGHLYHDFILPKNAAQVKIGIYTNNSSNLLETDNTVVVKGLRLTLVDNPEYELYKPYQTITLPRSIPGIPVTSGGNYADENGQSWICDEIDLERGVYVKRIGIREFDGSEDEKWFVRNETPVIYYTAIPDKRSNYEAVPNALLCSHFQVAHHMDGYQTECITETYYHNGNINILVNYGGASGLDGFVEYLQANPVTVQYILKTPIETPLTAEEITAFKALRTNHSNTTILNDAGAWMSVKYNADTKSYVENPKTLKLVDSSTGVVYELKIVDGNLTVVPV